MIITASLPHVDAIIADTGVDQILDYLYKECIDLLQYYYECNNCQYTLQKNITCNIYIPTIKLVQSTIHLVQSDRPFN